MGKYTGKPGLISAFIFCAIAISIPALGAVKKPVKKATVAKARQSSPAATQRPRPVAAARAPAHAAVSRAPAGGAAMSTMVGGVREVDRPLEVTGQSRSLSMMLTLQNEKDKIKFVEVRHSYKDEILSTKY